MANSDKIIWSVERDRVTRTIQTYVFSDKAEVALVVGSNTPKKGSIIAGYQWAAIPLYGRTEGGSCSGGSNFKAGDLITLTINGEVVFSGQVPEEGKWLFKTNR